MGNQGDSGQKRWLELDGVRGLAALLVIYAHLFLMWMPASPAPVFWLRTVSGQAWTGVYLFFVLSGFLIGGVLLENRTAGNYFGVFYLRRALRILPVYFVLLGVFALARWVPGLRGMPAFSPGEIPFWNYFLLIQNFPMAATGDWGAMPLGVTWSVALEEQFYLFLPLWVRFVPARWLSASFLGLAALGPVFRATAPLAHAPFLVPGSAEALFLGTWLAWAFANLPEVFRSRKWRKLVLGLWGLSGIGMGLIAAKWNFGVLSITVITIFWTAFLWLVLAFLGTAWTAPLRHFALRAAGTVSYTVYLFHQLISLLVFTALTGGPARHSLGVKTGLSVASIAFICTLVVAAVSFYAMENRLIKTGRRFKYRRADREIIEVKRELVCLSGTNQ